MIERVIVILFPRVFDIRYTVITITRDSLCVVQPHLSNHIMYKLSVFVHFRDLRPNEAFYHLLHCTFLHSGMFHVASVASGNKI